MSFTNDLNILRQIIMDHYEYPRNRMLKDEDGYEKVHMASESCVDDITVQVKIKDNLIEDVCFDGTACTITTASTSIMSELVKGKTIEEAKEIIDNYMAMIEEKSYDEEILEEAIAFKNVSKQANRIKCATIGWNALAQLIDKEKTHEQ